jgi:hypothetical protein
MIEQIVVQLCIRKNLDVAVSRISGCQLAALAGLPQPHLYGVAKRQTQFQGSGGLVSANVQHPVLVVGLSSSRSRSRTCQ